MRRCFAYVSCLILFALTLPCGAATGRVIKVLPFLLDMQGRHSLSPSLFERDAYQAFLRQNPDKISGLMYSVHWKAKGKAVAPRRLKLELRGIAEGNLPRQFVVEQTVPASGNSLLGRWTALILTGQQRKDFGEVTAWRVTLWEGEQLLGEERSFLW